MQPCSIKARQHADVQPRLTPEAAGSLPCPTTNMLLGHNSLCICTKTANTSMHRGSRFQSASACRVKTDSLVPCRSASFCGFNSGTSCTAEVCLPPHPVQQKGSRQAQACLLVLRYNPALLSSALLCVVCRLLQVSQVDPVKQSVCRCCLSAKCSHVVTAIVCFAAAIAAAAAAPAPAAPAPV